MLRRVALLTALLFGLALSAQETPTAVKTDWLSDQSGSTGKRLSAEVLAVKTENPAKKKVSKIQKMLADNDSKPYGLRAKLKKPKDFTFRLYLHQNAEQQQD